MRKVGPQIGFNIKLITEGKLQCVLQKKTGAFFSITASKAHEQITIMLMMQTSQRFFYCSILVFTHLTSLFEHIIVGDAFLNTNIISLP